MRVIFINPNSSPALNIGLTYVMSAVEKEHKINLLDLGLCGKRYEKVVEGCLQRGVDVVAFSTFTFNFKKALVIASFIKERYPNVKIIFGGIHPTLCPEEVISYPVVDAICIGEGENAFKEYLDKLEKGEEPHNNGIWFKDRKGSIIRNCLRPFEKDIDSFKFPNWDYWDIEYYIRHIQIGRMGFISSRGCPFSCTFCSSPVLRKTIPGDFVRVRNPDQVIVEIKSNLRKYQRLGFKYVSFDDEVFGLDNKFLRRFCSLYIKEGLSKEVAWSCQTRVDLLTDDYVDLITEAGCAIVGLGIETGDDSIRNNLYKKYFSNEAITNATIRLKKRNISYLFYMIYNAPSTDKVEKKRSIKLVKKLKPLRVSFVPFMSLPKIELNNNFTKKIGGKESNYLIFYGSINPHTNIFLSSVYLFHRIQNSFKSGLRLKKFIFICDLVKFVYIYLFKSKRKILLPSRLQTILFQLEYFTLFNYAFSNAKEKNLK